MLGEPDITKVVPGEGNLGVVDGRLRRTGDNYLYYLGAESPHIPVSGTYQAFVVTFSWHAHSDYSGPQITNMEWGFWRSDGMWWEVEVLCYGGGTDLYGTVDKDISSDVNQAIVEGCTWITLGFCFNDGNNDDWNQYVEIDDITATTGTSASAITVTRSTTITKWETTTLPLATHSITITVTATPPATTRSITITATGTQQVTTPTITTTVTVIQPLTTPTITTTETAIPTIATSTVTTTVTATQPVTAPNITTRTVTAGESTASQTVTYATYTTYTMTTTATVTSSLTYSRTIAGTVTSTAPFYSGVLVGVLAALIIVFGLFFLMRTKKLTLNSMKGKFRVPRFRLPKLRVPRIQSEPPKSDVHAEPIYKTLDDRVLEYIMSNKGTIRVTKASQDLGVEADFIRDAIQRLQRDGKLEPT